MHNFSSTSKECSSGLMTSAGVDRLLIVLFYSLACMARYVRYQYAPLADEMPEAQAVMGNAASAIHDQQQRATAQFKASLKALATATPFATCPPSSPFPDGEVHNSSSSVGNSSSSGDSFGTGSGRSNRGEFGRSDALSRSGGDDGALGEIELSTVGGEGGLHSPARALTFPRAHGLSGVGLSSHDDGGSSTDEESQMIV